ncbi:MAG TPA: STAS domain-containing protein [Anaerolineae bacterium]|nr:STAS domain-containing protein [Anaerolineae bacterium]HOR00104.1 STAS domain-containing protein [Anaerolineae bacterium]HPL27942.1 STAS domain-containing protein [Anaerolineae bacterium]
MEVTSRQLKRVDLVKVNGRVDSATAPQLEAALQGITAQERFHIVIDMQDLEYLSSAGLRVLVSTLKLVRRWNRGDLRLANVPPRISEVLDLAGLNVLFQSFDNTTDAVGSF